jgi:hypothetical protein
MHRKWIFALFILPVLLSAQTGNNAGAFFYGTIPMDQMSSTHKIGFEAGAVWNYQISGNGIFISIGGSYSLLPGKTVNADSTDSDGSLHYYNLKLPDYDYYKLILGPKFENKKRYFLLPAVIGVFDTDDYRRVGFEISGGRHYQLTEWLKLEASVKLSWLNILLKEENEKTIKTLDIGVSFLF